MRRNLVYLVAFGCLGPVPAPEKHDPLRPRLAVLIVFDQMRGDYLTRWYDLFPEGGFRRLMGEGAHFTDCHYPYANTMTGPGHATLATGCPPRVHGIVGNDWFDRKRGKSVYCVGSQRHVRVPAMANPGGEREARPKRSASPELLLAPTFADELKRHFGKQARVVALSLKDRSSVLPGGKAPDACYWADADGRFVTSTYYRDRVHSWVADFNASGFADRWWGKTWDRLRPDLDYRRLAGADDAPGEGIGSAQGRTFPHPFDGGPKKSKNVYYAALANSPFGNEILWELARRAIDAEKLGTRDTPDFLSVSFSSNDLIGHTWGPDSQEVLDVTLRSDRLVKRLLDTLDAKVGKGKYVVVLSADHGVCPLPEASRARDLDAGRLDVGALQKAAEEFLDRRFPPAAEAAPDRAPWIESSRSNMLYLDRRKLVRLGVGRERVEATLASWLGKQRGIEAAYTRTQMIDGKPLDAVGQKVKASFHPVRSGDVMVVLKPYWLPGNFLTGTTHGTPHVYDTHVPLVVFGAGVKAGRRKERVSPEHAAVILAAALGIRPPEGATVKVPVGLFGER